MNVSAWDASEAERSITIGVPQDVAAGFFRDERRLAEVMPGPEIVSSSGEGRGSATGDDAAGDDEERWSCAIVGDAPGQGITWQASQRGAVLAEASAGLAAAPDGAGTEATLRIRLTGPSSVDAVGLSAAAMAVQTLRNAKNLMEASPTAD